MCSRFEEVYSSLWQQAIRRWPAAGYIERVASQDVLLVLGMSPRADTVSCHRKKNAVSHSVRMPCQVLLLFVKTTAKRRNTSHAEDRTSFRNLVEAPGDAWASRQHVRDDALSRRDEDSHRDGQQHHVEEACQ